MEIERRVVSVLFADLVGFTALSSRLDAEDVATVQTAYFDAVRETVGRYRGQLEKFVGDAAMAIFGIPVGGDDDAERAVRAGLALVSAVEQVEARLGLDEGTLRLRVGVNSGVAVTADATPERGPVTGDTVNVAARLQAAAPPGGVLVGPETALAVAEAIQLDDVGALELKGKAERVHAWLVRGPHDEPSRDHAMGRLRAPTLGREDELDLLRDAFDRARGGAGGRVLVAAPPGVGKTRLVEEFAVRTAGKAAVWRARLRPDVLAPYDAVVQLLLAGGASGATLLPRLTAAGLAPARAAVVADAGAALLAGRMHERRGGEGQREAVFESWIAALDALSGGTPSVWIVEDVHWAGPDLLAFLELAGARGTRSGRLIVATARPGLLERAGDWCATSRLLHLQPLPAAAADQLVRTLTGEAIPAALVERIIERSDGNPLFIEELLRTWISAGLLVEARDGWRLAAEAEDVVLPTSVQAIYAAQLDDLPSPARTLTRRASVVGRRFAVAALEPLGVVRPNPALATLAARALIAGPTPDPLFGDSFAFRHALLRDAGYASLTRRERARLHVLLARWLETAAGEQWPLIAETVARHYATAADTAPALVSELAEGLGRAETIALAADWFERAAETALDIAAHEAARELLERALDLTAGDAVRDRSRRLRRLGEITAHTADMEEGARTVEQALELLRSAGGPADEHRLAAASLAEIYFEQLRFADSRDLVEQALDSETGDDEGTARLLIRRGHATIALLNDIDAAYADSEAAAAIAEEIGDEALQLEALSWIGAMHIPDRAALVRTDWADVERRARSQRRWRVVAVALEATAVSALLNDRPRDALRAADALEETASAHALTESLGWTDYVRTEALFAIGELEAALEAAMRAVDLAERYAYHRVVVRTWMVAMPIAAALGRRDVGARLVSWHDRRRETLPDSPFARLGQASFDVNRARLGLPARPVPEPDHLLPAFSIPWAHGSLAVERDGVVSAWIDRGEIAGAREAAERVERLAAAQPPSMQAATKVLRARVAAAEGDAQSAALVSEALATFRVLGHRWWIDTTETFLRRLTGRPESAKVTL